MSIKVALIGVGGYGYTYVENLCRMVEEGCLEIVAAAEFAPEKWSDRIETLKQHGAKIVKSSDDIYKLQNSYDLVCLPVGIESHAPLTIEALQHNCNVMVEKPLSGSTAACNDIISARNASENCFVAVGFQHFYDPYMQKIKKLLLSGALGEIKKIKLMGRWPRGNAYYERNYWAAKAFGKHSPVLDSPFCNAFAHYINLALYLSSESMTSAGTPEIISADLTRSRDIEMFDSGIVNFKVGSAEGVAMLTHCCDAVFEPQIIWECTQGCVKFVNNASWQVFDAAGNELTDYTSTFQAMHQAMFDAVIRRIEDPAQLICTPEIAMKHVKFIEDLYKKSTIKTLPESAYTIREKDGVRVNNNLEESWDKLFAEV